MVIKDGLALCTDEVKMTDRIARLRKQYFDTVPPLCIERARLLTQSFRETESQPMAIRRASAISNILQNISVQMCRDDLLLGDLAERRRGSSVFPEFSVQWIIEELNGDPVAFDKRIEDPYILDPEVKAELLNDILPYWKNINEQAMLMAQLPEDTRQAGLEVGGFDPAWISMSGDGHTIPNWIKLLDVGVNGFIQEAKAELEKLDLADPENFKKYNFYRSVIMVNEAIIVYANRLSRMAADFAEKETDPKVKSTLLAISENCKNVPANPAKTFHEGLQSILIMHSAIQLESNGHGVSFGRMDQYLYPLFQKDIECGRLTQEGALELMMAFYIKICEQSKLRNVYDTKYFVGYMTYPNLTIGGQTLRGKDAVNDLSYVCLAGTKKLRMIEPLLAARTFFGTDERFLIECAKCIGTGIGYPAFYNDDAIVPALLNIGYELDDAMDYGITGCVEPSPHGKIGGRYGASFPNPVKVLECTIYGGKDPRTGLTPLPGKHLSEMTTFEEFFEEFKRQEMYYLRHHVIHDNLIDLIWEDIMPTPVLSTMIDDCVKRGKEIKQGGAKYGFTGGQMNGTACCINCLAALKKVVFEDKLLTPAQLEHALATNFEDMSTSPSGEDVRQILLNKAPKFGNDDDLADEVGWDFIRFWGSSKMSFKNTLFGRGPIGGHFIPSTATVAANVPAGAICGATPDGRRAGDAVSEGISAYGGTDLQGPTSLVNSITTIPNILMPGGQLLNVKFSPSAFANDSGIQNFVALVRSYFAQKGFQMQVNVVDKETLISAQENPQDYKDLMIRVAGYSAYFVSLNRDLQNDIINRTEHSI